MDDIKWVPEWAETFTIDQTDHGLAIQFYLGHIAAAAPCCRPIEELLPMLADSIPRPDVDAVIETMRDKPLADRIVTADEILQRGADHIRDRAATRDQSTGERTMGQVVKAFNAIFGTKLTEEQGWQFMVLLKIVRGANGKVNLDDYEDEAAYAALAAEAAMKERA
jgi:hypothetical protein